VSGRVAFGIDENPMLPTLPALFSHWPVYERGVSDMRASHAFPHF